ncbi:MAG: type II toxin-antitoxin system RelE/ParE family toxin [Terracidiphilus sp.]
METPGYLKSAEAIFSETEREHIVSMVAANPDCGELMQGTGGFRKARFPRAGMGKRGGARVIYIVRNENSPVFLVAAYAKNRKENLTKQERNQLAQRADAIFASYRR